MAFINYAFSTFQALAQTNTPISPYSHYFPPTPNNQDSELSHYPLRNIPQALVTTPVEQENSPDIFSSDSCNTYSPINNLQELLPTPEEQESSLDFETHPPLSACNQSSNSSEDLSEDSQQGSYLTSQESESDEITWSKLLPPIS